MVGEQKATEKYPETTRLTRLGSTLRFCYFFPPRNLFRFAEVFTDTETMGKLKAFSK